MFSLIRYVAASNTIEDIGLLIYKTYATLILDVLHRSIFPYALRSGILLRICNADEEPQVFEGLCTRCGESNRPRRTIYVGEVWIACRCTDCFNHSYGIIFNFSAVIS